MFTSTATPSVTYSDNGSSPVSVSATFDAGSAAIGLAGWGHSTAVATTWAGLTEDGPTDPLQIESGQAFAITASDEFAAAQSGLTISATPSASTDETLVVAVWGGVMTDDLHDISVVIGRLEAENIEAQRQRDALFKKLDRIADDITKLRGAVEMLARDNAETARKVNDEIMPTVKELRNLKQQGLGVIAFIGLIASAGGAGLLTLYQKIMHGV